MLKKFIIYYLGREIPVNIFEMKPLYSESNLVILCSTMQNCQKPMK